MLNIATAPGENSGLPLVRLFSGCGRVAAGFLVGDRCLIQPEFVSSSPVFVASGKPRGNRVSGGYGVSARNGALVGRLYRGCLRRGRPNGDVVFTPSRRFYIRVFRTLGSLNEGPSCLTLKLSSVDEGGRVRGFRGNSDSRLVGISVYARKCSCPRLQGVMSFSAGNARNR